MVRRGEVVSFSLTPQPWAGQGLLGSVRSEFTHILGQVIDIFFTDVSLSHRSIHTGHYS